MQTKSAEPCSVSEKNFLNVLGGTASERVPVWLMRQAGRYLPEYRELRACSGGFLEMVFNPDTAAEITLQPIRRFEFDAAIIFSDILVVPHALGQPLSFAEGEGPRLDPLRGAEDIARLDRTKFLEKLEPVFAALSETRSRLAKDKFHDTALIGFAGAPWTVACYMIEGGGSKDFRNVKAMAYGDSKTFAALIDLLVDCTAEYLIRQVDAGAEALQIFDSWAGVLDPHGFQHQVIEPTRRIAGQVKRVHPDIPIIGFPRSAGVHYAAYAEQTGVDAVALDPLVCPSWAAQHLQPRLPVQGNLDPMRLLAGGEGLQKAARKILRDLSGGPHIFNLGHGVHKDTPPEHVEQLVRLVRDSGGS